MIVDGNILATVQYEKLTRQVTALSSVPILTIITCASDFATKKYLKLKLMKAKVVGVAAVVQELPSDSPTRDVLTAVAAAVATSNAVIVQLPLPPHIDTDAVLANIPITHDADAVHYNPDHTTTLPPVVGAIALISREYAVDWQGKQVGIVGAGRLVGVPTALWATAQGAKTTIVTRHEGDLAAVAQSSDILVLGAGQPRLITPAMIGHGVVIFDAGTAEDSGELKGDADPACAAKAALLTPVPGGIGPLTVAMLLENVYTIAEQQQNLADVRVV